MVPRRRVVQLLASGSVGGAQGSVTDLMLRLDRSGFAVEAVSLTDGPAIDRMRRLDLPVTVLEEPDDQKAVRSLAAHLRERKADVLHAHMFRAELLGARAARMAGVPAVVATVHSSRIRSSSEISALAAENAFFDRLIAPSESIAHKLRHEGRGAVPITVVPNGVDLDRFGAHRSIAERTELRATIGIPADAFLIGVVARLEPEKGHRYLLAAWPEIVRAIPNAWLLLVGDGSLGSVLRAQATSSPAPAGERVIFAGGQTDMAAWTRALDLAILPSIREAQGIALLEAMAAGVPVVASAVGGIPETIRDRVDGLLVPPANPDAQAAAVIRLSQDVGLRRDLALAGRRRVEDRFDIVESVHRMESVYVEELARTAPRSFAGRKAADG
jgi:glycosyltransferase involved in cell wall biosynthesis